MRDTEGGGGVWGVRLLEKKGYKKLLALIQTTKQRETRPSIEWWTQDTGAWS